MNDTGNSGTSSSINIANLTHYVDCTQCEGGTAPPTPTPTPTPPGTNKTKISSQIRSDETDLCEEVNVYDVGIYYSGTLGDGTYVYSDNGLTTIYQPQFIAFVKSQDGYFFKIGDTGNIGEVSEFGSCADV
jgi:hypothetical protein